MAAVVEFAGRQNGLEMRGDKQKSKEEKRTAGDRTEGVGLLQSVLMAVAGGVNICSHSLCTT